MRTLLILTFAILAMFAEPLKWESLSYEQRLTAVKIYNVAESYDLAETMIAIAWQESRLGLVPINLDDPSCGVFHFTAKTYLWQNGMKNTLHNRNVVCMNLINSVELSTENAIKYFLRMKKHFKGNHDKAIKSYNAGYKINSKRAKKYGEEVRAYMKDSKVLVKDIRENSFLALLFL